MSLFKNFNQAMLVTIHNSYEGEKSNIKIKNEVMKVFYKDLVSTLPKNVNIKVDFKRYKSLEFYSLVDLFSEITGHVKIQDFYFNEVEQKAIQKEIKESSNVEDLESQLLKKFRQGDYELDRFSRMWLLKSFKGEYLIRYGEMFRIARKMRYCSQVTIRYTSGASKIYYRKKMNRRMSYDDCNKEIVYQFVKGTELTKSVLVNHESIESISDLNGNILWRESTYKYNVG